MDGDDAPPSAPRAGWRTVDVPWFVLAGGLVAFAAAVLALTSIGSGVGIALAAVLVAAAVGVAIVWSDAPFGDAAAPPDAE